MKVKLGNTIIASVVISTLVSAAVNLGWDAEFIITCYTVGSSGTVQVSGALYFASNSTGTSRATTDINNAGVASIIDTTISQQFDVTATWNTSSISNSITFLNSFVKGGN